MLTKSNKVVMYIISIVTIILGLVTAIPFRTLPFASNCPNVLNIEFFVKFIMIPEYALGASIFPNILKYKQIKSRQERSKVANIFSYLPVLSIIIGQLILLVHTLTFKYYPMSAGAHAVLLAICVCYLVFMICVAFAVNNNCAKGLPTELLLPITKAFFPSTGPVKCVIKSKLLLAVGGTIQLKEDASLP